MNGGITVNVCQVCLHKNPIGAIQCENCLNRLPQMFDCPGCGTKSPDSVSFCAKCGAYLRDAQEPSTASPPPSPVPQAPPVQQQTPPVQPAVATPLSQPAGTVLQQLKASLTHMGTNQVIELPTLSSYIKIGKPGGPEPPDIDLSPFPNSDIVSRVHAAIKVGLSGDMYIEDRGSSNGTYLNFRPVNHGDSLLLRDGDSIMFGKENKVVFSFKLAR